MPLRSLNRALTLGKLGLQTVLVSEKAFKQIRFIDAEPVDKTVYYPKFFERDTNARQTYVTEIAKSRSYRNDIFVLDILREEMANDDPRIQRILDIVNEVVDRFSINQYTLVCQSNRLYLLSSNYIWVFAGDYHHSYVAEEEKLIFDRQAKENALLHVNRDFKWIFPVNPSRFEQLIADIIEYQQPDTTVRLVGRTNNPDGGRDIIIRRKEGENRKLTICQCKAYQNSVNKSHVTDIRDTLDYYEATGFLLAVTSDITAPLIDHLTSLEKKYDVDWWTRRELFKIMRQYPSLVNAYQDIIKVVDNKEGQS